MSFEREQADAVVIGAGPNGLVAANLLADAGWDVVVLEAGPSPGGGVSSADYLGGGYVADVCSAFYPLAAVSPVMSSLRLEDHGLEWVHSPDVLAHPMPDGRTAVLNRRVAETADNLSAFAPEDGAAWRRLVDLFEEVLEPLRAALFTPFPPMRAATRLARVLGPGGMLRFARLATLPVRRLAQEEFRGEGGPLLLAGCAMHADLSPESAGSSAFGWLLAMLGQHYGFPVPKGGAGQITAALTHRLEARGGRVVCNARASRVVVQRRRASAVATSGGPVIRARRAVLADVAATHLYGQLVPWEHLPSRLFDDIARFQWDYSTFKVDWALSAPVPWSAKEAASAGTVHLSDSVDEMTRYCTDIATGRAPARPFVLLGQMATADSSRAPAGGEVVWAYTHIPREVKGDAGPDGITGAWDSTELEAFAARIESRIETYAPGFSRLIRTRHVMGPHQLEGHDPNLVGGAINGGTTSIHQQLVFRPTPGLGRPETPVAGLYLASASAHPGGAVHGACGANAARAALKAVGMAGRLRSGALVAGQRRIIG
ncbi:MAG TPA: NAD(P)/FAD-dependent oxidoreductase [Acidimicrobiales bacterium]|nr:NAD(P)/FAD-dependent oxidoreductase [Acidimicrobiales bacterium]